MDTPVDFSGWRGPDEDLRQLSEIRIGLFVATSPDHPVGGPITRAAALAVDQINEAGGFDGIPVRLAVRWDDDPWRGGSKQVIKLVYEDSVWAVIGSVDGAATHIAEQVVTKAWLPLLSPASSDPTLTYIRIPWMFRLPPDDSRQAAIITARGIGPLSLTRVGLVTSDDHDGRVFADEMLARMRAAGMAPSFHFQVASSGADLEEMTKRIRSFSPDGLVIRLPRAETRSLLRRLRKARLRQPVMLPWIPGLRAADLETLYDGQLYYVQPFSRGNSRYDQFARSYRERYGEDPTCAAAYAYDAVTLIVDALRQSGLNRARLRDAIAQNDRYHGVTGAISWDNAGGNRGEPVLIRIPPATDER